MRTLRLSLVGTVILALLGGVGGVVVAQSDEEEVFSATHVTGKKVSESLVEPGEEWFGELGVEGFRGQRYERTWEWSDPRLPAAEGAVWNANGYMLSENEGVVVWVGATRLDGPDGSWSGTGMSPYELPTGKTFSLYTLVGHGAYEGLTAILDCDADGCEGYILEAELPPIPEAPEPPAE